MCALFTILLLQFLPFALIRKWLTTCCAVRNDKKQSELNCRRNTWSWIKVSVSAAAAAQLRGQKLQLQCCSTLVDVAAAFPVVTFPVSLVVGRSASCNEREVRKEFTFSRVQGLVPVFVPEQRVRRGTKPFITEPRCWTCGRFGSWLTKRKYLPAVSCPFCAFCVSKVYLFERDTYPKLWRHATPTS